MTDPREMIDKSAMTSMQFLIVGITVLLNAMDGIDVLTISIAAPGILAEWGIDRTQLGIILSMEMVGMAFGSILLGGVADRYGRRNMMLGSLMVMSSGMFLATTATSPATLSIWRIYTGLGIGGMLSTTLAVVAEFSNNKNRALCVAMMTIGYPIGGIFCGEIGKALLVADGSNWRSLFYIGMALSASLIPVVYFLVPESVHWLTRKQPVNSLERVNSALRKLGKTVVNVLPEINAETRKKSVLDIFSPNLVMITTIVTMAYFFHITTFYFILKWTPTLVVQMGIDAAAASGVISWANIGGALGGAAFGLATMRIGLKPLTITVLVLSALGVTLFGRSEPNIESLSMMAALAGFFGNAGVSAMYSIAAYAFPTHVRATGTGFVIGVGRGGAVLSPMIAGYLLNAGTSVANVAMAMAAGSMLAAVVLIFLKLDHGKSAEGDAAKSGT
jgi:benzoate transport